MGKGQIEKPDLVRDGNEETTPILREEKRNTSTLIHISSTQCVMH